jgi:ATP-dependent Clp protease ATP-binding subunit ClpA
MVDFKNTFIILTSNLIVNEKEKDMMSKLKTFFKPEFLNRLDEIIRFQSLKKEDIRQIVDIQISRLQYRLDEHGIKLHLDDKAKDWLAENGYDPEFGARPLKRLIQQEVENPLAIELLSGKVSDNVTVNVSVKNNRLILSA